MVGSDIDKRLSEAIASFLQSRAEIKEESLLKGDKKKLGYAMVLQNLVEDHQDLLSDAAVNEFQQLKKSKKGKEQTAIEFQREKYQQLVKLADNAGIVGRERIYADYEDALAKNLAKYQPKTWLNENCKHAAGISFATHVAKLTHSSISDATSIYNNQETTSGVYLITSSLAHKEQDSALDNAAYAAVAEFLKIQADDGSLGAALMDDNAAFLSPFSDDQGEIQNWMSNLKKAFISERNSSHTLAKQIYWPVTNPDQYHLLLPLTSSSMAQALHLKFSAHFDDQEKKAREQRRKRKYSPDMCIYYPNKAVQRVTASNHTNASALNGKRGGRIHLLSCAAPQWKTVVKVPSDTRSLFGYEVTGKTRELTAELQKYLLVLKIHDVSLKKTQVHRHIRSVVNAISAEVFDYCATIQALKGEAGWSKNSTLPLSHQLLLDIHRQDDDFRVHYRHDEWHREIAQDFGKWLNHRLKHKHLKLGPIQAGLWRDIFLTQLQTFAAEMEISQ